MRRLKIVQAKPKTYDNIKVLVDRELKIAQRSCQRKGTWYLYKIGPGFHPRSLGTTSEKEARSKAFQIYGKYQNDPDGEWWLETDLKLNKKSFKDVAEAWLSSQSRDLHNKQATVRKFLIPFFHIQKQISTVSAINELMIDEYKQWRRQFWIKLGEGEIPEGILIGPKQVEAYDDEPSPQTLNREYPALRQILKFAYKHGYTGKTAPPDVPSENAEANPRPAFIGGDYDRFYQECETYLAESKAEAVRAKRQLLLDWVFIGRWTGLRYPHEAAKLTWADIRLDTLMLFVHPDTKTGKRDVPFSGEVGKRLAVMRDRRQKYALSHGGEFSVSESVFALPDGTPFQKFSSMFNEVVRRCSFPPRPDQMSHTPYSLRHTFATFCLAEDYGYERLEEIMGTSTKMLKEYYKGASIEQTRRFLQSKRTALGLGDPKGPLTLISYDNLSSESLEGAAVLTLVSPKAMRNK